jgi:hypothetical protein
MTKLPTQTNTTIEDVTSFFDYISEASSGLFFNSMLFGIFIILFMMFRGSTSNGKSFAGSSFICMILSIIFRVLGWTSTGIMYTFILFTGIGAVWAYLEEGFE